MTTAEQFAAEIESLESLSSSLDSRLLAGLLQSLCQRIAKASVLTIALGDITVFKFEDGSTLDDEAFTPLNAEMVAVG